MRWPFSATLISALVMSSSSGPAIFVYCPFSAMNTIGGLRESISNFLTSAGSGESGLMKSSSSRSVCSL